MIIHSQTKNQVNISNHSEIKWWQLNIWPNFKAQQQLQVCQKSFNRNKFQSWSVTYDYMATTKYLAKFRNPRAITRPNIIGPERNVNMDCNSSLYTRLIYQKSSQYLHWVYTLVMISTNVMNWTGKVKLIKWKHYWYLDRCL